ncbi:hypothetical protein C1646_761410 [Rhizophagus diaphanus]|nr:hypothetical protein C1646_761410 [Rhizophagus diaphanus] [Rhizophagus sp. MUCL 43196]
MDEAPKNLWVNTDARKYQVHVAIPTIDSTIEPENEDERVIYIGDLEKREQAYGICGECNEPGMQSQLNAVYHKKYLEWIPFEKFQNFKISLILRKQKWRRSYFDKYALKSLNNSSDICSDFLNELGCKSSSFCKVNFKNLPKPVNSSDLSSFQFSSDTSYTSQSTTANPKLNEICQGGENNIE